MKIKKAILPVAGMGTRFLPATKAQPKEMLPIFDTPAIQLIIEEAVEAGIEDIIIVTGRGKQSIENHFDDHFELEYSLKKKGKIKELEMVKYISRMANISYVRQSQPLGDGHAILQAKELIGPEESAVILFGDDIVDNNKNDNAVEQLIKIWEKTNSSVVLLEEILKKDTEKYGIVDFNLEEDKYGQINRFVEKPKPEDAPSNLAAIGKFIITPDIFTALKTTKPGPDGEIRLANAFEDHLNNNGKLYGKILEGKRFDTGDKIGFLNATLHYAMKKDEESVKKALQNFMLK
jgi:UTP--glucose-1-phosphate uridylyltransferase